ncbi:universal stress protein [Salmonirosea aquatica]|uniref:Universal stress protein n=1 Tax=Salmonirosea aquatica TaxID=2654236 RepID=A0A7C9BKC3_9BACT|nr:universal stress protein [Cytophagaceae bacterium SJW1-29]
MKKILIPIDFSENADRTLNAAKALADKGETQLLILHAYQPPVPDLTVPSGAGMVPLPPDLEETFRKRLEEFVATAQNQGYRAEGIWSVGGIHPAVFDAIKHHRPDMVVLGRSGTGGFLDRLLGSSATHIGLDATCPVLIVPPQATPKKFKEIVYATQLEYDENEILRRAFPLFQRLGGRVSFIKINSDAQPDIQSDQQYIDQITSEFSLMPDDFVVRESDSVLQGIEDYCDEIRADLLVMSTRPRGFLEAFITNPSVTKKMIVDTHVPLLVYHMKE